MHLSLNGFVAGPSRWLSGGEMNWIKVDEEIFVMPVSGVFIVPRWRGKYYDVCELQVGVDYNAAIKVHPN